MGGRAQREREKKGNCAHTRLALSFHAFIISSPFVLSFFRRSCPSLLCVCGYIFPMHSAFHVSFSCFVSLPFPSLPFLLPVVLFIYIHILPPSLHPCLLLVLLGRKGGREGGRDGGRASLTDLHQAAQRLPHTQLYHQRHALKRARRTQTQHPFLHPFLHQPPQP